MTNVLLAVFIGSFTVTAYQSKPSQTDSTPYHTSIQSPVSWEGIAVSQDQLCPRAKLRRKPLLLCQRKFGCPRPDKLHYGDRLYIPGVGYRVIDDCMNIRHKERFDVWVASDEAEKFFDTTFRTKLQVYLIKGRTTHERRVGLEK